MDCLPAIQSAISAFSAETLKLVRTSARFVLSKGTGERIFVRRWLICARFSLSRTGPVPFWAVLATRAQILIKSSIRVSMSNSIFQRILNRPSSCTFPRPLGPCFRVSALLPVPPRVFHRFRRRDQNSEPPNCSGPEGPQWNLCIRTEHSFPSRPTQSHRGKFEAMQCCGSEQSNLVREYPVRNLAYPVLAPRLRKVHLHFTISNGYDQHRPDLSTWGNSPVVENRRWAILGPLRWIPYTKLRR
jgi:hypothetical protein